MSVRVGGRGGSGSRDGGGVPPTPACLSQAPFQGLSKAACSEGASLRSALGVSLSTLWRGWREELSSPPAVLAALVKEPMSLGSYLGLCLPQPAPGQTRKSGSLQARGCMEQPPCPGRAVSTCPTPCSQGGGLWRDRTCLPSRPRPQRGLGGEKPPAHPFPGELSPPQPPRIFQVAPRWPWAPWGWPGSEGRRKGPATPAPRPLG